MRGFTLIELLVSAVVLITIGALVVSILSTSLRGTNKTNVINNLRQNGSYAILHMGRTIGYAQSFDGVSTDSVTFTTSCVQTSPPSPTPTPVPIQYRSIKVNSVSGGSTIFSCEASLSTIFENGVHLIDTSSVRVDSCLFTCNQEKITDPPIIGVHFVLSQKGSGLFSESKFSIPFSTSVVIRNWKR